VREQLVAYAVILIMGSLIFAGLCNFVIQMLAVPAGADGLCHICRQVPLKQETRYILTTCEDCEETAKAKRPWWAFWRNWVSGGSKSEDRYPSPVIDYTTAGDEIPYIDLPARKP
jgi:hypothetical protein